MPLFSIQTRPRDDESEGHASSAAKRSERRADPGRKARPGRREESSGGISAVMLGMLVGVALLGGVTLAVLGSQLMGGRDAGGGASAPPAGELVPASGQSSPAALPQPLNPGPINGDYPRDYNVAYVNGQPYTMAELETAVRIARTLGRLSGDPVPNYDDPEILGYQVKILKRQVDLILLNQALRASDVEIPVGPVDDLILGFLQQVGATEQQLGQEMAANSVTREQLDKWFDDSRASNAYIIEALLGDRDISERDAVVEAWLSQRWDSEQVVVDFYDPQQVLPQAPAAPAPAEGESAP